MKRILTGIQATGTPHLGNILGAIKPALRLAAEPDTECFFFIADLHALTTVRDAAILKQNTHNTAVAWLANGLDVDTALFYRQSDVPQVTELSWYLNCLTPYPMLANAHAFKDKSGQLAGVNAGLFDYPVLMAADILLYDAQCVPVGKDQKQHLEMTRDIAQAFNRSYGHTFVLPEVRIDERIMCIPGADGKKMSKSYGNHIDIFLPKEQLRKQIMQIVTDSTPLESPKEPDVVFALYELLASPEQTAVMRQNYRAGNYGYGQAKQALFELILEKFKSERARFDYYCNEPDEVESRLAQGAAKARAMADKKLKEVRGKMGFTH
ncbi:MAG: tryptophan--tRNA ligase [Flavobacteriales bacterium]